MYTIYVVALFGEYNKNLCDTAQRTTSPKGTPALKSEQTQHNRLD